MESITMNGKNTWNDFGLKMINRIVDPPDTKRNTLDLPGVQGVMDFSRGEDDELFFEERILHWTFGRIIKDRYEREYLKDRISQWAYDYTDGIIRESLNRSLHYKDAICVNCYFSEMKDNYFRVQMDFSVYPLRISDYFEGNNLWDTLNFETDFFQEVKHRTPPIPEKLPFIPLSVGDSIAIGGWAQFKAGQNDRIGKREIEQLFTIKAIRNANDEDHSKYIYSGMQYQLAEDESWVRAQDIVQSYQPTIFNLWNVGKTKVIPEIVTTPYTSTFYGITVEQRGNFYNFGHNEFNDKLAVFKGENELKVYGHGMDIEILWQREVI